ncbi:unnamed protein product, partial [Scytosiphon promiscuus]
YDQRFVDRGWQQVSGTLLSDLLPVFGVFGNPQGDVVRNVTWPAWEVSKKALVFPSYPGRPLPLQDQDFVRRLQD